MGRVIAVCGTAMLAAGCRKGLRLVGPFCRKGLSPQGEAQGRAYILLRRAGAEYSADFGRLNALKSRLAAKSTPAEWTYRNPRRNNLFRYSLTIGGQIGNFLKEECVTVEDCSDTHHVFWY